MKKTNQTNNFLKLGIFLFGISVFLWNCEKQNLVIDNPISVPSITESKTFFLENNSNLKTKNPNSFVSKIKWENSKKENYKKDIDILYSPISVKANRAKSFVASVKINGKIDNQIITLLQNRNASQNTFSGVIFIHNKKGEFICAYSYENGVKTKKITPKKTNSNFNAKTNCDSNYNLDEIIWIIENSSIDDIPIPNNGVCVDIYDYSRNLNSLDSNDDGGSSWSDPSDDLNTDDGPGGGSNSWSDFNCLTGYKKDEFGKCVPVQINNELTNPCAKNIFTELENGIFKEHPIKPEVTISNDTNLNFSETILKLFNDSDTTHYTIQNGFLINKNAFTDPSNNTTTISNSYLQNATRLSIARTMIHEQVHAFINSVNKWKPGFRDMTLNQKLRDYAKDHGYTDLNRFHHEFMSQYVSAMAFSLYEWDKRYGSGKYIYNNPKPKDLLGWDYYMSMAYGGLIYLKTDSNGKPILDSNGNKIYEDTDSFKVLKPIKTDRDNIKKIINDETAGNSNSKGTKC